MFKKKRKVKKIVSTPIIDDNSPFAFTEAYNSLRTNFNFATFDGELKTILVTSSIPNEGKSSVSINLARTLSIAGYKVLLIDADLRNPSVGRNLRIRTDASSGFSMILSGKTEAKKSIYNYSLLDIDLILSGPIPPNAAELFARPKTGKVFEELRGLYDYIIVDTPPVGVVTDAAIIAKYIDGAIFVVRHNYTHKDVVKDAIKKLKNSDIKILGAVMNDYDASKDIDVSSSYEYQYVYGSND